MMHPETIANGLKRVNLRYIEADNFDIADWQKMVYHLILYAMAPPGTHVHLNWHTETEATLEINDYTISITPTNITVKNKNNPGGVVG